MFSGLESLIDLHLGYVGLQQIPNDMWKGFPALHTLNLYGNSITSIHPNTFRDLSNLRVLDLTRNKLTTVRANTWRGLVALNELILTINYITTVERNGFAHLPNIDSILMAGNRLTSLEANVFNPEDYPQSSGHPSYLFLDISRNPLHCDHRMCWLKKAEQDGWKAPGKNSEHWTQPSCANFPGYDWKDIDLNCTQTS